MMSNGAAPSMLRGPSLTNEIRELTGETLIELLERAVQRHPGATALVMRNGPGR